MVLLSAQSCAACSHIRTRTELDNVCAASSAVALRNAGLHAFKAGLVQSCMRLQPATPRQWRNDMKHASLAGGMVEAWAIVLLVLLVSRPGCCGRRIVINAGACRLQTMRPNLAPQHVRFFYWTLPVDMADEVRGYCGSLHMAPWDGVIVDSNPLGVHLEQNSRGHHAGHDSATGCSFGHLHATNQFAAEAHWRQQVLISPLRTDDVNTADVVVVDLVDEYCMSLSINDHTNKTYRELFWHRAMSLLYQHVNETSKPHMVPLSRPAIWYWGANGGPDLLSHEAAQKVTWLSTELTDFSWAGMQKTKHTPADYYVVAQPYPTTSHFRSHDPYFAALHALHAHSNDGLGTLSGIHMLTSSLFGHPCYIARKSLLATGSFGSRYPIRHALRQQCRAAGERRCVHYDTTRKNFFKLLPEVTETLGRAWFCLMPPGDTHSRRALMDCLMQDTIPVVFNSHTRDTLPYSDIINPAEYVVSLHELAPSLKSLCARKEESKSNTIMEEARDVLGLLETRYPVHVRIRMVHKIFTIKHMFQPMLDPVHQLIRFDQLDTVHCLDDAFTSSFKAALRSMCRRKLLPPNRCNTE